MLVASMTALGGPVDIGLTGGRDSRVILAAALAADLDVVTTTTLWDGMAHGDLELPPRIAQIAGVPHYTARAGRVHEDLVALFDEHCARHSVERVRTGLASGHHPDHGRPVISGNVFELGRFYYHSLPKDLDSGFKEERLADWVTWVQEHPEPLDWRDRFYWEQRLAGWASSTAQAVDIAPFERFFPANSRRFVSTLLHFPEPQRRRGAPQQALLELLSPELARLPFNPERNSPIRRARREIELLRRHGRRYVGERSRALRSRLTPEG
jgi:hypothetical protein